MVLWKTPTRRVWHSVVCPNCHRLIQRIKLPGVFKTVSQRLCSNCLGKQPAGTSRGGAREGRRAG